MKDFGDVLRQYLEKYKIHFNIKDQEDIARRYNRVVGKGGTKIDQGRVSKLLKSKSKGGLLLNEEMFKTFLIGVFDRSISEAESEVAQIQILDYFPKLNSHHKQEVLRILGATNEVIYTIPVYTDLHSGLRQNQNEA